MYFTRHAEKMNELVETSVGKFMDICDSESVQPTVYALQSLPAGSVALVGAHSGTIYRIFGGEQTDGNGGLGIDTTGDPIAFPKASNGKVPEFGDLWKVTITNSVGKLDKRISLQVVELKKQ